MDFGSHVTLCAEHSSQFSITVLLDQCGEAKISNFEVEVGIEEKILGFQVPMSYTLGVHVDQS